MNLIKYINLVPSTPKKFIRFVLPNTKGVSPQYHITEIKNIRRNFVDQYGSAQTLSAYVLQVWAFSKRQGYRSSIETQAPILNVAGKLPSIMKMAEKVLPHGEKPVEVEYEAPTQTQFVIVSFEVVDHALVFHLESERLNSPNQLGEQNGSNLRLMHYGQA